MDHNNKEVMSDSGILGIQIRIPKTIPECEYDDVFLSNGGGGGGGEDTDSGDMSSTSLSSSTTSSGLLHQETSSPNNPLKPTIINQHQRSNCNGAALGNYKGAIAAGARPYAGDCLLGKSEREKVNNSYNEHDYSLKERMNYYQRPPYIKTNGYPPPPSSHQSSSSKEKGHGYHLRHHRAGYDEHNEIEAAKNLLNKGHQMLAGTTDEEDDGDDDEEGDEEDGDVLASSDYLIYTLTEDGDEDDEDDEEEGLGLPCIYHRPGKVPKSAQGVPKTGSVGAGTAPSGRDPLPPPPPPGGEGSSSSSSPSSRKGQGVRWAPEVLGLEGASSSSPLSDPALEYSREQYWWELMEKFAEGMGIFYYR